MRLALAQIDSRPGDVRANVRRARESLRAARAAGADLVVFPELQLSGYSAARPAECACSTAELAGLAGEAGEGAVVLGFPERDGDRAYNSAAYFEGGSLVHVHRKLYLVGYEPFDEDARFTPGEALRAFDTSLGRVAILICNDAWQPFLPFLAAEDGARLLVIPSSSPTAVPEAERYWRELTRFQARMLQCFVAFANRVGREGELTFWGGSHVVDPWGDVVAEAARLEPDLLLVDLDLGRVDERRAQLRIVGDPRLDLLRAELGRLEATRSAEPDRRGGRRHAS